MTKKEFESKLFGTFTLKELALINTNVYWNDKYIDYYIYYKCMEFKKCFDFLVKNRHLLTPEYTPEKWEKYAKIN